MLCKLCTDSIQNQFKLQFLQYILIKRFSATPSRQQRGRYFETKDGLFRFPDISEKPTLDLSVIVPAYNEEDRCKCS